MLKIKDNVDLKELEKFGFIHHKLIYVKEYVRYSEFEELNTRKEVSIEEKSRNIRIGINSGYMQFNTDIELDIIYDLIKADIVEKVDD